MDLELATDFPGVDVPNQANSMLYGVARYPAGPNIVPATVSPISPGSPIMISPAFSPAGDEILALKAVGSGHYKTQKTSGSDTGYYAIPCPAPTQHGISENAIKLVPTGDPNQDLSDPATPLVIPAVGDRATIDLLVELPSTMDYIFAAEVHFRIEPRGIVRLVDALPGAFDPPGVQLAESGDDPRLALSGMERLRMTIDGFPDSGDDVRGCVGDPAGSTGDDSIYTFIKGDTDGTGVPLQLLDQRWMAHWGDSWCGPTAVGISMGWFAETQPADYGNLIPGQPSATNADGKITFSSNRDGNFDIYVMTSTGGSQTRLTTNTADDEAPVWSPDGKWIAFNSNRDGNFDIYVMTSTGGSQTRLTINTGNDFSPDWSPDGKWIAFNSDRDGDSQLYVMTPTGGNQTRLTINTGGDSEPAWSPDSSRIAFTSSRDGNNEIYVMTATGGSQTRLTNNTATDWYPDWSHDGSKIAFTSTRDGNFDIYVMTSTGGSQVNLTTNTGSDSRPDWGPGGSISGPVTSGDKYNAINQLGMMMNTSSGSGTTDNDFVDGIESYINHVGLDGEFVIKVHNHPIPFSFRRELLWGEDVLVGISYVGGGGHWLVGRSFNNVINSGGTITTADDYWDVSFVDPWTASVYHTKMRGSWIWYNGEWARFDIMVAVSPTDIPTNEGTAQYFVAQNESWTRSWLPYMQIDYTFTLLGDPDPANTEFHRTMPLMPDANGRLYLARITLLGVGTGETSISFFSPVAGELPAKLVQIDANGTPMLIADVGFSPLAAKIFVGVPPPTGDDLEVRVMLQGAPDNLGGRPDPEGWQKPLDIMLFPPGSGDNVLGTPAAEDMYHCDQMVRMAPWAVCKVTLNPAGLQGPYDVAVMSDHGGDRTLIHVERNVSGQDEIVEFNEPLREGNMNVDRFINAQDFAMWLPTWKTTCVGAGLGTGEHLTGDLDNNCIVNLADFTIFLDNWREESPQEGP